MGLRRGIGTAPLQVPLEPCPSGFVQRDQAALAEFRTPDHEAIGREVFQSKVNGLRDAQSGGCKQRKEGAVRITSECAIPRASGGGDELSNLLWREDVRCPARPALRTECRGRHLMADVFRPEVAGEANDVAKATGALGHRSGEPRPVDGKGRTNIRLTPRLRKRSKALEQQGLRSEGEAGSAPDRHIGRDGGG